MFMSRQNLTLILMYKLGDGSSTALIDGVEPKLPAGQATVVLMLTSTWLPIYQNYKGEEL